MSLTAGTSLGRYDVRSLLGRGGMGEVYLAEDTRLHRPVALKLLPLKFTEDGGRLRRFEQEALAASALNHPNILTIYEVGAESGAHFIATEFVEGTTLRQRMSGRALKLGEALDIAVQIASALQAAHKAGIIHRDIKPENIMVRSDGIVKVLDFGLAKLAEDHTREVDTRAPTLARVETSPGTVLGTTQYMSPEQTRGLTADARSDLWSLGVVLYEMVAGRAPFEGETQSDMIVSILDREPPSLEDVPAELERILRKALRKDGEERYQSAKEMAIDLKSLRRDLEVEAELERSLPTGAGAARASGSAGRARVKTLDESGGGRTGQGAPARPTTSAEYLVARLSRRGRPFIFALLLIALALASLGLYKYFRRASRERMSADAFQRTRVTKLTTSGNAANSAVSPDGKYVAYVLEEGDRQSLWLRQVATAGNVQLIKPSDVQYGGLSFSPDGDYIYYTAQVGGAKSSLYRVAALGQGGAAMKVLEDVQTRVSLSPDGRQFTFVRFFNERGESSLMVANADGTGEQTLLTRKLPESFGYDPGPAWSPGGKAIACSVLSSDAQGAYMSVVEIRLADHATRLLSSHRWQWLGELAWLPDGSGFMMVGKDQESSFAQVWLISYPDGAARKLTNDLSDYINMTVSADGRTLVTMQNQVLANLFTTSLAEVSRTQRITSGAGRYFDLSWTPDGKILYASDASGSADIWEMDADGANQRQLTVGSGRNYAPAASPDGRYIVFHSNRSGNWNIWRMDRDGNNPKQLTFEADECNFPEVSPDGRWVVYDHLDASAWTLWRVPIDGGTPVRLNRRLSARPAVSPDGKWIACWHLDSNNGWRIGVIPFDGGDAVKLFDVPYIAADPVNSVVRWTPDGRALLYRHNVGGFENLWSQPLTGGKAVRFTDFNSDRIFSFDISHDGRLVISRGAYSSDVVMISDLR